MYSCPHLQWHCPTDKYITVFLLHLVGGLEYLGPHLASLTVTLLVLSRVHWIFLGVPLKVNGALGNTQGNSVAFHLVASQFSIESLAHGNIVGGYSDAWLVPAIIWTNAWLLVIRPLGTNFNENLNQNTKIFIQEIWIRKCDIQYGGHFFCPIVF